jgi:nucleotidyltransferase/DNA polymerase involved in DNA repair
LICSIGVCPSKIVAKIASDFKKPDGLTVVKPSQVKEFLSSLPVRKIPGIRKKTEAELKTIGIELIGQLANYDIQKLLSRLGRWGIYLHNLARGTDESEVREEECCKSFGREITFDEDTNDSRILNQTMEVIDEVKEISGDNVSICTGNGHTTTKISAGMAFLSYGVIAGGRIHYEPTGNLEDGAISRLKMNILLLSYIIF